MIEPAADIAYLATADALAGVLRIAEPRSLASADVVREQMVGVLREFVSRCREGGVSDQETAEARYALIAFIDDRLLRATWHGRAEWQSQPLQLQYFREFTAGENFFIRMGALIQRGGPLPPLQAYYMCLALGFQGAAPGGRAARGLLDAARTTLLRGRITDRVAPNAVPADGIGPRSRPFPVAVLVGVLCVLLCVGGLGMVSVSLTRAIDGVRAALASTAVSAAAPSGAR
ncbi:MAG: DotU family type IV/VI secretion system protein [Polyangiaceae bacterium]|jgi:type VI secretion system protein ImpK